MSVNLGQAVGYLDLDTTKFKAGFKSALSDLKVFQSQTATSKDKLAAFSSAATSTGRSLTKGLTVPLVGIGAASVAVTAKFDEGMSKVQAVSGATGKELEQLRDKAKEMGAKTKFSATQSAEAFNYMAMAGWKTEDMLNGIDGVMNLAAASGEDLGTTSDIVTDALTAFGLSASDSAHFADVLAANASNANTNVAMLGESFKYIAPVAGSLGYSVEDINLALGLMANSGIKASQAGTTLRGALTRMAKPTGEIKEAMEKYNISLTDAEGNMVPFRDLMSQLRDRFSGLSKAEQAQAATTLFGKNAMSGMLAIINSSDKDWNKLANAIDNADGTAEKMAETMMDNLPGALTLAKSALEGLGIRIGEVITPAVTKVVKVFTSFISWLSQASDGTVRFAVGMGAILASIGPVLLITGTLTRNVLTLIEAYEKLNKLLAGRTIGSLVKSAAAHVKNSVSATADAVANSRFVTALKTGPIGAMVSKVMALAAAHKVAAGAALGLVGAAIGLAIYMKKTGTSVGEMKTKVVDMFNNLRQQLPQIVSAVSEVASSLIQQVPSMISSLVSSLGDLAGPILQAVSGVARQLPSMLSSVLSQIGSLVVTGLSTLKDVLPKVADWWANDMPQLIAVGADMVVSVIDGFTQSIPALIEAGTNVMVSVIDQFFAEMPKFIDAGMNIVLGLISGLVKAMPKLVQSFTKLISQNLGPMLQQVIKVIMAIAKAIIANLPTILSALTTIILALVKALADNAPTIIAAAFKLVLALAKGRLQAMPQILVAVGKIALALVRAILAIAGSMVKAGIQLMQALWRGISSWAGALLGKVKQTGRKILQAIKNGIGNLASTGRSWITSLWNGIKAKVGGVISSARSKARKLPSAVKGALGSLYSAGRDFIQGLWNGMKSKFDSAISWAKGKAAALPGPIKKILGIGSPSWIMRQYGEWFIEGLQIGMEDGFKPLMRTVNSQMDAIISAYNPLSDYDFGIGKSLDVRMLDALSGFTLSAEGAEGAMGNVINQNISVEGVDNPAEIVEEIARQLKISMRTV